MLAYPAYLGLQYRKLPAIHDITTDPIDPPRFEALARLRSGEGTNPAVYAGLYSAEQQRSAYPDIETVELELPVQRAYEITLQLVNRRKWLVIDERAPQPPRRIGRIEAVARTPIMGFRERSRQQRGAGPQADRRPQQRRRIRCGEACEEAGRARKGSAESGEEVRLKPPADRCRRSRGHHRSRRGRVRPGPRVRHHDHRAD